MAMKRINKGKYRRKAGRDQLTLSIRNAISPYNLIISLGFSFTAPFDLTLFSFPFVHAFTELIDLGKDPPANCSA
eukprot:CAMPEP_0194322700 /NCGR_PEP_ID=MMETSP0171-20130528/22225_1 /TAXON_ID=218684 /ORGANISM="Corethron pennatum, Strain L29A3" /LENGTH=74 /DNA_ID=CAMNT_0039081055 /DNA_START=21 /DNA_END=242 /DNA_ORIENTATION=-